MDVQLGPNALDEPNLLYKLQRKIQVFATTDSLPNRGYSLVATSSQHGIVFVASPDGILSVYYLKQLVDKDCDSPPHISVKLQEKPTHIAVNCDSTILAVLGGGFLFFYNVAAFENKNAAPLISLKADVDPSVFVSSLQWNPCVPEQIAVAYFNGVLLVAQVQAKAVKKVQSKARCICWSPKGKQLVTGNSDGSLCQFKPDLTLAKTLPAPNLFEGAAVEANAIYWISTYQFVVVFKNATDNSRPAVTIVNTPKGGQMTCLNYEDICYSMSSNRPWYYYLQGIPQWNLILASSSNSMEIATLGSADGANWFQWCQPDEARPELPLTDKKQENFPVGICIDTCAIHQLPWGENETLPHMPLMLVVSQTGLLTVFNVINLNKAAPQICSPPQQMTLNAADLTSSIPGESSVVATEASTKPADAHPKSLLGPPPQPAAQKPSWAPPVSQFGALGQGKPFGAPQQQEPPPPYGQPPPSMGNVAKPQVEIKPAYSQPAPAPAPQQAPAQPKPPPAQPKPAEPTPEANAQIKAEQERANALKANKELKKMLVAEVNEFQTELYKFKLKTREMQRAANQDLAYLHSTFVGQDGELGDNLQSLTAEHLRKEWSLEELRAAVIQLKLDLVRTCAVVAEARTHSEVKDAQWTQTDPLSTKRLASVKRLAYYVQNQLDQAHKALDYKWREIELGSNKYGPRIIRPILDDVYQPLVKQQEILSRQEAVLKTLKKTLNDCDATPVFKGSGLLRSTPFKKDPLSKLTKNILNMSIEPDSNRAKESAVAARKLDALRDLLSNHKTTRVKHVEIGMHLAAMRLSYERSAKEKAAASATETTKSPVRASEPTQQFIPKPVSQQVTARPAAAQPFLSGQLANTRPADFVNAARTLFTDEPVQERILTPQVQKPPPPSIQVPAPVPKPAPAFSFAAPTPSSSLATRSALKDLLQSKAQLNDSKSDANTFMGQKICSPTSFTASTPVSATPTAVSKPAPQPANVPSKYQSKAGLAAQDPAKILQQTNTSVSVKSAETGEPEGAGASQGVLTIFDKQKDVKPLPSLFVKPLASNTQNVPPASVSVGVKIDGITKLEPKIEKSKENVSDKTAVKEGDKKENSAPKTLAPQTSIASSFPAIQAALTIPPVTQKVEKPMAEPPVPGNSSKEEIKVLTPKTTASSLFANATVAVSSAPKPPASLASPVSTSAPSAFGSPPAGTTCAASIFSSAAQAATAFGTPPASPSSAFGTASSAESIFASAASATQASVFGKTSDASSPVFGTSSAQSVFAGAAKSVSSTPSSIAQSVFGTATSTTQPSVFASPTSAASVFASAAAATTTQASVFGTSTATTQASVFGSPNTAQTSAFGSPTAATQASVFGTTTGTTQASVFAAATPTTQASVFSTPTTTQASVFGTTATTQASVFGTPTTTQASVFGTTATTQASVFATPTTTQASVFGTPTTTQASVFGTTATTQASVFGMPTATTQASVFGTNQSPVFGTPTTQASIFGTPSTQSSVFGTPTQAATTQSGGSLFGGAESNLFAAASISTTSAPSQPTGSIFGGGSPSSVFGAANTASNVFGGKAAFGQSNATAASIFGGGGAGATFGQKQQPASGFWGANTTSSGSVFGGSAFGQTTTTQASIFGTGSFSAPSTAPAFGAPQGSVFGGGDSKPASVFGSPQQAAAPAFGGSSVFGAKPAFGQSAGFGSPAGFGQPAFGGAGFNKSPGGFGAPAAFGGGATFGGGAAFGSTSPGKMFGGGAPAPGFGSPTQSNATFESLATQNTMTFGNLAQQSPQQAAAPTFNTSPSFTGWRG